MGFERGLLKIQKQKRLKMDELAITELFCLAEYV
jgi:hypothetical protein